MDKQIPFCNPEVWGGIECTINRVENTYFDQLQYSGHYTRNEDLERIAGLGIKKIRYPILWEKHQPHLIGAIDWHWTEKQLTYLKQQHIDVIAGLLHHGSGPAFTHMLDSQFPYLLADYAKQVARKFPWIEYYTPVNEPLTTARFSGLYGIWYPHKKDDKSFVQMLLHEVKGIILSMQEIRKINPGAKLVQTEDLAKTYSTKRLQYQADFENQRRWLTFDLLCGKVTESHPLYAYLQWIGIDKEELQFFTDHPCPPDVIGFNYYLTSERFLDHRLHLYPPHTHGSNRRDTYADVEAVRVKIKEPSGLEVLLKEGWERFGLPIAITEVHLHCHREEQLRWFQHVWHICCKLREEKIPVQAVTAWALLGSYGWNKLLTQPNGDYEPGVFDLRNGTPRPTALVHYIQQIQADKQHRHPVGGQPGWWHRNTRFLQAPRITVLKEKRGQRPYDAPVLIVGKRGTLGRAFARVCGERAITHQLLSREECDIADSQSVENAINTYKPWAIINAAGFVKVDAAEVSVQECVRDNTLGPQNLAKACKRYGIKLLSFSSDLVFDGAKKDYYIEEDIVSPLNVYGKSKAEGEQLVLQENKEALVIRTSAFFSPWDHYNFVTWILSQLAQGQTTPVANDVYISPTYVPDLVHTTLDLLIDDEKGIWHLSNYGKITWADLAHEVAARAGKEKRHIEPVPLQDLNLPAKRPYFSALSSKRGNLLPSLDNALQRFFDEQQEAAD